MAIKRIITYQRQYNRNIFGLILGLHCFIWNRMNERKTIDEGNALCNRDSNKPTHETILLKTKTDRHRKDWREEEEEEEEEKQNH